MNGHAHTCTHRDWDQLSFADEVGRVVINSEAMEDLIIKQIHDAHEAERKREKKESKRESPRGKGRREVEGEVEERREGGGDGGGEGAGRGGGAGDGNLSALPVEAKQIRMRVAKKDGSHVIGQNGEETLLYFSVRLLFVGDPPPPPPPRTIEVNIVCARNLPKMDTFGSCDAFCQVAWQGILHKSEVRFKVFRFSISHASSGGRWRRRP